MLKTLEQADAERMEQYKPAPKSGNGIACPKCQAEMQDDTEFGVLCSNPPRVVIRCKCGHSASRIQ